MLISVFTPTYNRASLLRKLYDSLCVQSFTDFEWLIVDDGSADNTEEIVNDFIAENKIGIRYIKQQMAESIEL
jgi:glycosyltransferase involved in cell wall biosynthesis